MSLSNLLESSGRHHALKDLRKINPNAGIQHVQITPESAIHLGRIEALKDAGRLTLAAAVLSLGLYSLGEIASQNDGMSDQPSVSTPATSELQP